MSSKRIPLVLGVIVAFGCSDGALPTAQSHGPALQASVNGVTHRVTVGGPDACSGFGLKPGCDKNFSLVALDGPNGVTGHWHDGNMPSGALDATVSCLEVVGNEAWINGVDRDGGVWLTRVRDNGTSANDSPDQISFSFGPFPDRPGISCHRRRTDLPLVDMPQGQVTVQ
jgi:hypothetical protein